MPLGSSILKRRTFAQYTAMLLFSAFGIISFLVSNSSTHVDAVLKRQLVDDVAHERLLDYLTELLTIAYEEADNHKAENLQMQDIYHAPDALVLMDPDTHVVTDQALLAIGATSIVQDIVRSLSSYNVTIVTRAAGLTDILVKNDMGKNMFTAAGAVAPLLKLTLSMRSRRQRKYATSALRSMLVFWP